MYRGRPDRLLAAAALLAIGLAGCGSTSRRPEARSSPSLPASATTRTVPTATSAPRAPGATTTSVPIAPAGPGTVEATSPPGAGRPAATTETCAQRAATNTFIRATRAAVSSGGSITLYGQSAALVCGGPDDLHYSIATTAESAHLLPGVTIERVVFPNGRDEPISPVQLQSYLAGVPATGIFLVTGPLTAVTAVQEQYHP